ncbi:MAG TPA: N-acetyltransferase [Usitatibacteraceae bacterium]|nr:N-acetyltransferase [Usitatibacteraceae bacterium]
MASSCQIRALDDTPEHRRQVAALFALAEDYHLVVEGTPAGPDAAEEFFREIPAGYSLNDLHLFGLYEGEQLSGVASVLKGWNAPHKAIIGLLVLAPEARGRGWGRDALIHIECVAKSWPGIDTLRVAVLVNNGPALAFWRRVGFVDTGEIKPRYANFVADIVILEKPLSAPPIA